MINKSLIPEQLKSFNYYKNKLPLYLRQSNKFQEHFKIWYDVLVGNDNTGVVGNAEILLNLLNIFDDDYFTFLYNATGVGANSLESDILDKLAAIFGVNRKTNVVYTDQNNVVQNETLTLTNQDLLVLIKARIVQNYCDGTREVIQSFYDSLGLAQSSSGLELKMHDNPSHAPATVEMYLIYLEKEDAHLTNLDKMFLAGLLKIESMGIVYYYSQPLVPNTILVWANEDGTGGENVWGGLSEGITYEGGRWII